MYVDAETKTGDVYNLWVVVDGKKVDRAVAADTDVGWYRVFDVVRDEEYDGFKRSLTFHTIREPFQLVNKKTGLVVAEYTGEL